MAEWYESFEFDKNEVGKADAIADRLTASGKYNGRFTRVNAIVSQGGTKGIEFEFQLEGFEGESGKTTASLYTEKADGQKIFGSNMVQALMGILGVKRLAGKPGKVMVWDNGKKVENDGIRFGDLEGKPIGVLWQKEITDRGNRFNISGFYDTKTLLMASEIRDGIKTPGKLEKALKNLKDKDSRTNKGATTKPDVFGSSDGDDSVM